MTQRDCFRQYFNAYNQGSANDVLDFTINKGAPFQVHERSKQLRSVRKSLDMMVVAGELYRENAIYYKQ